MGAAAMAVPAQPEVRVQATYEAIRTAILGNRLRPGAKLTHRVLAETFGVSRTPVRESLERLYQEGLVTRVANRGYFVAEMPAAEVVEIYQTRAALELHAVDRLLAGGIGPAERRALDALNARYGALCERELSRERLQVDRDFHLALAAASGNGYLCRSLAAIFDRLIHKRRVEGFHGSGVGPHDDHVKLLAAIDAGDRRRARALLGAHIDGACARFVAYLDAPDATR